MTPDDTAHLVERIVQTWPNGPKGRIWTEAITNLDAGRAGTSYVRLRDEAENAPTIGRFMAIYRSLDTSHHNNWRKPEEPDAISLDDYLARLNARAEHGDRSAADELQLWARWRRGGIPLATVTNLFDDQQEF